MLRNKFYLFKFEDVILFLLALCILPYSIFSRFFAELHIKLPFLDFPIFVGEIFLFVCLALSFYNWIKTTNCRFNFSPWKLACIFYIAFVLIKVYSGYLKYGPLALRHAAMFYYPFLALIAYYAFQRGVLIYRIRVLLFILMLFIIKLIYVAFFLYTYVIIALVLALTFKKRVIRYFGIALTLAIVPYSSFFDASRTLLVASLIASFSLLIMGLFILRTRRIFKIYLLFLGMFLIIFSVRTFGSRGVVFSLTNPGKFMEYKSFYDASIESKKGAFKAIEIIPRLYNPNEEIPVRKFKSTFTRLEDKSLPGAQTPVSPQIRAYEAVQKGKKEEVGPAAKNEGAKLSRASVGAPKPLPAGAYSAISKMEGMKKAAPRIMGRLAELAKTSLSGFKPSSLNSTIGLIGEGGAAPDTKFGTMLFRSYVYTDAIEQILNEKHLFGFPFGKPFRSMRCEMVGSAYGEYSRDGWIAMHNSYLDIIYRAGLVGIILIIVLFINTLKMAAIFLKRRSFKGAALITIVIYWLTACFFTEILELPYYAIFFWSIYGVILSFAHSVRSKAAGSMGLK